jgi:T4 RnlA family RNA ligase
MILETQKCLRDGKTLDQLHTELGIEFSSYESLVVLNYSQIDSPRAHPIVMECRGLILERDTWNVVSYPFRRFFNYDEMGPITENFNFTKATGLGKLDGSLISVFNYKDKWLMSTRGVIENVSPVGLSSITFKDLFYKIVREQYAHFWECMDPAYCYIFEMTAPENHIVTMYTEQELHLLAMRDLRTLQEVPIDALRLWSQQLGVELPLVVPIDGKDGIVALAKNLATLQEGFVAVDYSSFDEDGHSFKRVKVKNPAYVSIAHLKDNAGRSLRALVGLVIDGDVEEFLSYFNEFRPLITDVQTKYTDYMNRINSDVQQFQSLFDQERTTENKKTFAMSIQKCANVPFMFSMYNKQCQDLLGYFKNMELSKSRKHFEKYMVQQLRLKDVEITFG